VVFLHIRHLVSFPKVFPATPEDAGVRPERDEMKKIVAVGYQLFRDLPVKESNCGCTPWSVEGPAKVNAIKPDTK
jgi:hypothetical protein